MTTYGFIGLGHQGTPMAERMIGAGLRPWLWARRDEVLQRYQGAEAVLASGPQEVGQACDVVGLCLYDAAAIDAVLFGAGGLMEAIRPGCVLAVHSTVGPAYVQELSRRVAERSVAVVDAPVSGGPAAATGQLLVISAGEAEPVARCQEMFASYAGRVVHAGKLGAAQAAKLVNNVLMTAITGLVFDAFGLGASVGIDQAALGEILANGSAANPSIATFMALGVDEFSNRAWPTLHKDVALAQALGLPETVLVEVAASTITQMARRRPLSRQ